MNRLLVPRHLLFQGCCWVSKQQRKKWEIQRLTPLIKTKKGEVKDKEARNYILGLKSSQQWWLGIRSALYATLLLSKRLENREIRLL